MPGPLLLNSLEIHNFRAFRELKIERLGRVNLIVGKNNVGKTSVLEAIRLYARPGSLEELFDIHEARDDVRPLAQRAEDRRQLVAPFDRLFHQKGTDLTKLGAISIGPDAAGETTLRITVEVVPSLSNYQFSEGPLARSGLRPQPDIGLVFRIGPESWSWLFPTEEAYGRGNYELRTNTHGVSSFAAPLVHVPPGGFDSVFVARLWDDLLATPVEAEVISTVNLTSPNVKRIITKYIDKLSNERVPYAQLDGEALPVPLRNSGDGANRLFGIAVAIAKAEQGFFLVDEIENGLHYSVLPDIWRAVFRAAARLNVQVFATTHSSDCVRAFNAAALESDEEGMLIRLERFRDRMIVDEFNEEDTEIAVDMDMEVRG